MNAVPLLLTTPGRKVAATLTALTLLVLGGMVAQGPASATYLGSQPSVQGTGCSHSGHQTSNTWNHDVLGDSQTSTPCNCNCNNANDVLGWWDTTAPTDVAGFWDGFNGLGNDLNGQGLGSADVQTDSASTVDSTIDAPAYNAVDVSQNGSYGLPEANVDAASDSAVDGQLNAPSVNDVTVDQTGNSLNDASVGASADTNVQSTISAPAVNDIQVHQSGAGGFQSATVTATANSNVQSVINAGSMNSVQISQH